jgi:isopentenyldiphosphate isomerase
VPDTDGDEVLACVGTNGGIFPLPREQAHREKIHHLVVRVLACNPDGEFAVQCRSASRDTYPGRFTDSASGHVSFQLGLLFDLAGVLQREALRELEEELGLSAIYGNGHMVRPFHRPTFSPEACETSYCFVVASSGKIQPSDEVDGSRTRFVSKEELGRMLSAESFVPEAEGYWLALLEELEDRDPLRTLFRSGGGDPAES